MARARLAIAAIHAPLWLVLSGCASDTGPGGTPASQVWVRPDGAEWRTSKFRGDRLQCRTKAGTVHVHRTRPIFEDCMVDRGYELVQDSEVERCPVEATGTFYGWPEAFCVRAAQ